MTKLWGSVEASPGVENRHSFARPEDRGSAAEATSSSGVWACVASSWAGVSRVGTLKSLFPVRLGRLCYARKRGKERRKNENDAVFAFRGLGREGSHVLSAARTCVLHSLFPSRAGAGSTSLRPSPPLFRGPWCVLLRQCGRFPVVFSLEIACLSPVVGRCLFSNIPDGFHYLCK